MYNKISAIQTAPRYGLIMAAIHIIFTIIMYVLGLSTNQAVGYISFAIIIVMFGWFIHLAISDHKQKQNGFITLGEGFLVGLFSSLIYGIILSVFSYILFKFIDPNLVEEMILMSLEQQGDKVTDQMEEGMRSFMTPEIMSIANIFTGLCCGSIISLIVALIHRNDPTQTEL